MKTTSVFCPYCGNEIKLLIQKINDDRTVFTCDVDTGGCDQHFVVETKIKINVAIYKLEKVSDEKIKS